MNLLPFFQVLHIAGGQTKSSQLREALHSFLVTVGKSRTIEEINISSHKIGYNGAVYLSKALQINPRLKRVFWDDNNVNIPGTFSELLKT